ncbi:MAG TPA: ATP-binding protein [Bacteroidia bacterium]|nr:ATP-binding protein [Bacteroidia bacterium]HRS58743.1 ATP-binding protein [Bacteroidia bacterium]HRU67923.1 ATP-binding protein [Bacteroidia bacterium]
MQTISAVLIGGGIIFMVLSIFQTRQLLSLQEGKMFKSWKILSYFIVSFLLGYIGALVLVFLDKMDIMAFITGMVFLGGAMFVFLVIRASVKSSMKLIETASAKNYLNDIFQNMGNILIVLDEHNIIKTVNPTTCEKLGCDPEKIIGNHVSKIFNLNGFGKGSLFETEFMTKTGKKIPVLVSVNHLKDFNKNFIVIVAQDISIQKENERKLKESLIAVEKANKELDQFAYIVSHDLKAPLRAINNLSEWIIEDLGEVPEEVENHILLMRGRVNRMENLINGILEYSRVGRQKIEKSTVSVRDLVKDVIDNLAVTDRIAFHVEQGLPVLETEQITLQQVFSNLISNAVKYHDKPKGNVEIRCFENDNMVEFMVKDDGPGIPEEYHEKIFGIFQTIEARDTVESTGIGLSIVKKIIEEKGGKIWIESKEGKGTTFHFTWPKK